ncbi:hypothetical protein W97_07893 [Coniosporium apollinis CBS 100218]|uniref:alpha-glucosidase n=1 Tax=Coniosporium apollinis (strain CBS 100218) TaxID=1168221 RepID=R7Z383_CONA1|nr:uncharacterized protein W97_07893 [Coniosporium apollinis CBS 100218]EON68635.1 hypothetical protein W97_07893 [Coniosporium apollinis CBS 100218]
MYFPIVQALKFAIASIKMFGTDTYGFARNAGMELCTRWMQLSTLFPFYPNYNVIGAIPQEAFRWTQPQPPPPLFYHAHTAGETVMRALAWEFSNDLLLRGVDNQFMLGPGLLITPVLKPLVTTIRGVFPSVVDDVVWYDYYALAHMDVWTDVNTTLQAPLEHIHMHVRGGSIVARQAPGNTTATLRRYPWGLLVALNANGEARCDLYIDDGESLVQFKRGRTTCRRATRLLVRFAM